MCIVCRSNLSALTQLSRPMPSLVPPTASENSICGSGAGAVSAPASALLSPDSSAQLPLAAAASAPDMPLSSRLSVLPTCLLPLPLPHPNPNPSPLQNLEASADADGAADSNAEALCGRAAALDSGSKQQLVKSEPLALSDSVAFASFDMAGKTTIRTPLRYLPSLVQSV